LQLLESEAFDVVVVDPSMGRWRGLEVCRSAARGGVAGPLPVVTLAASRSVLCALRSRLAGARMHLSRPVRLEQFVAGVWSAGSRWRGGAYVAREAV
jgi:CheY-like chemotaxis protein